MNLYTILIGFLILIGIYFYIRFFANLKHYRSHKDQKTDKTSINSKDSLMTSLAACLGTGNIVGIGVMIAAFGPGTVFWMWIQGIIGIIFKFFETYFTCKTKRLENDGYYGGAHIYISKVNPRMGVFYTIILFIALTTIGVMIQANAITTTIKNYYSLSALLLGILLALFTYWICKKGTLNIIDKINKILPTITILYFSLGFIILFQKASMISEVFQLIIKDAFSLKTLAGSSFFAVFQGGFMRGLFSNEAGIGSGSLAFGCNNNLNPYKEGLISALNPIIDTLLFCTLTSFIILTSDYVLLNENIFLTNIDGNILTGVIFTKHFQQFGSLFISVSIFLFGFAAILGTFYYGKVCLKFLKVSEKYYLGFMLFFIIFGSIFSNKLMWHCIDYFNMILLVINIFYLFVILKKKITFEKKDI